ncbi:MAG TPA: DNA-binding domain-containing protein [Burkholderiales bacterium]|jgi:hypothetical protein|nr:DNA-binding domain-containing protein [Burkholderiales bacterium]
MRAHSLPELQAGFLGRLFSADEAPEPIVAQDAGRFSIYRATVFANLGEALRAVYPVVERLTGERFFAQAARHFVRDYPSASGDLHRYGAEFPLFLASFQPAASLPYLADVARLEWLWHEAFHAADHQPLDRSRLAAIPAAQWPQLRLGFQPAARLLRSRYPVHRIWQVNQPDYRGDDTVSLDEGEARLLVFRAGYDVVILALCAGEYALVDTAMRGAQLARAVEEALAVDSTLDVNGCLRRLVEREVVVDVFIEPTNGVQPCGTNRCGS